GDLRFFLLRSGRGCRFFWLLELSARRKVDLEHLRAGIVADQDTLARALDAGSLHAIFVLERALERVGLEPGPLVAAGQRGARWGRLGGQRGFGRCRRRGRGGGRRWRRDVGGTCDDARLPFELWLDAEGVADGADGEGQGGE